MINMPPIKYKNEANKKLSLSGFAMMPTMEKTTDATSKTKASQSLSTGIKYSSNAAKNVFIDCAIAANIKLLLSAKRNVRSPFLILSISMIIRMPIKKKPANKIVDLKSSSKCMNCSPA